MDTKTPLDHRHYYRCLDCLATVCIEADAPFGGAVCGICGGNMDWMGVVTGAAWRHEHREAIIVCDADCQCATGPDCRCACGGANHGIGYGYRLVIESGVVKITPEKDAEKRRAIAAEYRAESEAAERRIAEVVGAEMWDAYKHRAWIADKALWWQCRNFNQALNHALAGKIHSARMKKLRAIAA